jgi:hypothetical protein
VTIASAKHMDRVARNGCVVGNHGFTGCQGRIEVHHCAEGSGKRSDFSTVGLCEEHHRGGSGIHGMGVRGFCALYRPPGESEMGLLVWLLEDMAKAA